MSDEVVFDAEKFRRLYPKFSDAEKYPDETLSMTFEDAKLFVPGVIPYDPKNGVFIREFAIYKAMCHLLTLQDMEDSGAPGRVASASQGSVSTSFDLLKSGNADEDFWMQTTCGQLFLRLVKPYALGGRFLRVGTAHPFG